MAKQYLKDLINMDYDSLINLAKKENIDQFKSVLTHMAKSANRRIKTLEDNPIGKFSPALKSLKDAGINKFDIKSIKNATTKDTGKLLEQFSNLKQFLKAKTSRLSGWQSVRTKVKKRIGAKKLFQREYKSKRQASYWINRERKFWKLYNKLVDEYGGIISQLDSDKIQKMLYKVQSMKGIGKSDELVQDIMEKYIDKLYQAKQKNLKFSDSDYEDEIRLKYQI